MKLLKDFLGFTKLKFIVFILLSAILFYLNAAQDAILGNFSVFGFLISIFVIYLYLNIVWFAFIDKKHFAIGLLILILLSAVIWVSAYYSAEYSKKKREKDYEICLQETNSVDYNGQVIMCMQNKGYKLYR